MRYLLDTTAFSAAMRREDDLMAWFKSVKPGNVVTAPPVVAEIEYGLQRLERASRKYQLLVVEKERLCSVIAVVDWIPAASRYFGKIKAELENKGLLIDDFDIAISAIAMSHDCSVLTANVRHFRRVEDLICKHW